MDSGGTPVTDDKGRTLAARDFVQSLERGLAVIEAFDEGSPRMGLPEVANKTGLTRAATRRFLLTLVELGYMRMEGNQFSLRPRILALGHAYLASMTISDVASPRMKEAAAETGESFSLSVLDGDDIVYIAQVTARRPMAVRIDVGTRFPAYATSMGRILLAHMPPDSLAEYLERWRPTKFTDRTITDLDEFVAALDDARAQGFAVVDRELDHSLHACAVGVPGANGSVEYALSMSLHSRAEEGADPIARALRVLRGLAADIAHDVASLQSAQQAP
jgi:IclR family pca regulon transcriptional regulator